MTTLSLFVASLVLGQQGGDLNSQKITFSQPAMTLERLLPKLGEAAGVKMEADKSIKNEVVLVQVKDIDLQVLMDRIAEVSTGTWEKSGDTYELSLAKGRAAYERDAHMKQMARLIDKARIVDEERAIIKPFATDWEIQEGLASQLKRSIATSNLVTLGPMQSVVYALPANRSQLPLPNQVISVAQKLLPMLNRDASAELAKIMVIVSCTGLRMYQLEIRLLDSYGQVVGGMQSGFDRYEEDSQLAALELPLPSAPIEISPTTEQLRSRIASTVAAVSGSRSASWTTSEFGTMRISHLEKANLSFDKPIEGKLRAALLKPIDNEPLRIGLGESLQMLASSQSLNLVACLPDSALVSASRTLSKTTEASALVNLARNSWGLDVQLVDGSLVVKPIDPHQSRQERLDRKALQKILTTVGQHKPPSIDDWAEYFGAQPLGERGRTFDYAWFAMIDPEAYPEVDDAFRQAIKFYGMLGKPQRQILRTGGTLPLTAVPIDAKQFLLGHFNAFSGYPERIQTNPSQPVVNNGYLPLMGQITEAVPDFSSMRAVISLKRTERPIIYGISDYGNYVGLDHKAFPDVPSMTCYQGDGSRVVVSFPLRYPKYTSATRLVENLSISLMVNRQVYRSFVLSYVFTEDQLAKRGSTIPFASTPKDFQDWVLKNEANVERQRGNGSGGSGKPIAP